MLKVVEEHGTPKVELKHRKMILRVAPGADEKTICCSLEHISGEAVDVLVPYTKAIDGIDSS